MPSQQSISQKRSWRDTETRLFFPLHQTTSSVISSIVGPPPLHWLGYRLVVLWPLHCCFLPCALSFFFLHAFLVAATWFCIIFSYSRWVWSFSHPCIGFFAFHLGQAHWLLMSPFLASHRFSLGRPIGPLPYSFLLGLFQGPFLFLKEGHPTVAISHNCPYPKVGQWALSLVPHGYFFLFGPLFGPFLLTF